MAKSKKRKISKKIAAKQKTNLPTETRAAESLTVFWSVTVLMVLVSNLVIVLAHFYLLANPGAQKMAMLQGLLLFTGSVVGCISLIVLPFLFRIRQVPPPLGLAIFGACVAVAPILAALFQLILKQS